jgi:hypothetical protein
MNGLLHRRLRRIRERELIRSWEYRQRNYASGAWYRLRRALVDAAQAWAIDDRDADRLEREGCLPLPVGGEFAPPLRIFLLSKEQLAAVPARREVPVRLCAELLQARNLVLLPHDDHLTFILISNTFQALIEISEDSSLRKTSHRALPVCLPRLRP